MKKRTRNIIRISTIVAIVVLTGITLWFNFTKDNATTKVGDKAVDFKLKSLEGEEFQLHEVTKDKGVIINFWGTWCKPCREEMPDLNRAQVDHKDDDVMIITVNVSEKPQQIEQFLHGLGEDMSLTMLLDPNRSVTKAYNIGPLPTTIAIDKNNKIVKKQEYQLSKQDIESFIEAVQE